MQIGIYSETDPLNTAVTWGPVGAEAVLAQFYPSEISLFLDNMDVVKARKEALLYYELLKSKNVQTFLARDILANSIKTTSIPFSIVHKILIQKADDIKSKYGTKNHKNYKEIIEELLKLDVERYGEAKALTLNWKLSLYPFLPLGNLIYARDQMNVLLSKRIRSHMKEAIRRPEVELYELVYENIFDSDNSAITIPTGETFEGGDAYIHDSKIFIGIGSRTSIGAALFIYQKLKKYIEEFGYEFVLVVDENYQKRSRQEQMDFMHLDTFSNPVGKNKIALCISEAKRRKVYLIKNLSNKTRLIKTGKSFLDYLFEEGQEIIAIPEKEQQSFGCNFLTISEDEVIVPLDTNSTTINELKNAGKKVVYAHLNESTKGYGAAHCMTGQLLRKRLT